MAIKRGEIYRCPYVDCGCEVTVTQGPRGRGAGVMAPRCCCGVEMEKI
jgi:hypothetical protein